MCSPAVRIWGSSSAGRQRRDCSSVDSWWASDDQGESPGRVPTGDRARAPAAPPALDRVALFRDRERLHALAGGGVNGGADGGGGGREGRLSQAGRRVVALQEVDGD